MNTRGQRPSASGRPRVSSRETLADAAAELFLEQTYAGTTMDDIARRAGVSRATLFNYVDTKSDLLWVGIDDAVDTLAQILADMKHGTEPMQSISDALTELATGISPNQVPLALTQVDIMGADAELHASALPRFLAAVGIVSRALATRTGRSTTDLLVRSAASALVAATASAILTWATSGVRRGELEPVVRDAISPICDGFAAVITQHVE